jgi:hypothetical protein
MLVSFFLAGCHIDPCDPGQVKVQGASCVPAVPPPGSGDGGPSGEAGEDPKASRNAATNCSLSSQFGDACADSTDCRCLTNHCAILPGEATGSCTRTGCIEDPSVCPAGFQCVDLSSSDPNLPSICLPPT